MNISWYSNFDKELSDRLACYEIHFYNLMHFACSYSDN